MGKARDIFELFGDSEGEAEPEVKICGTQVGKGNRGGNFRI